jgi:hypothetical protein
VLGAEHLRLLTRQHKALDIEAFGDLGVDDRLHARELLVGEALGVGEVEAQPLIGDVRAALVDVVAEDLAQRGTEQVRRGYASVPRAAIRGPPGRPRTSALTLAVSAPGADGGRTRTPRANRDGDGGGRLPSAPSPVDCSS